MVLRSFKLALMVALFVTAVPFYKAQAQSSEFSAQVEQERQQLASYGFYKWEWLKNDCSNCELFILTTKPELRTEKVQLFIQSLGLHKSELQMLYKIHGAEYNLLAHMAIGILGRESEFFTSTRYQFKETFPILVRVAKILRHMMDDSGKNVSNNSRGPTQIKIVPKKVAAAYGITPDDLHIPDNAAIATMGFLIESLNELKRRIPLNKLENVTPETYVDYLPYIYFGSSRALVKKTATPDKNLYVQAMKHYMSWVEVYERESVMTPLLN
ncbi:hypothetical protein [Bdellovibrio sp. HCB2-146]|uniref:hypothetical protein n=1 Tax=Bdellovibrio sp. HCB2-146 TaxID=3394362 RepID=UPI0039BD09FF